MVAVSIRPVEAAPERDLVTAVRSAPRLTCRPHNDIAARLAFGDDWMDQFTRKRGRVASARPAAP